MSKNTRIGLYLVVAIAIIATLTYSVPQFFENLQTRFIYTQEYVYYVDDQGRQVANPIVLSLQTLNGDVGIRAGEPIAYAVILKNEGQQDVRFFAFEGKISFAGQVGNSTFSFIGPSPALSIGNFPFETITANQVADINGDYVTTLLAFTDNPNGVTLAAGQQMILGVVMGSHSEAMPEGTRKGAFEASVFMQPIETVGTGANTLVRRVDQNDPNSAIFTPSTFSVNTTLQFAAAREQVIDVTGDGQITISDFEALLRSIPAGQGL
jgi:hypothetical protein